MKLLDGRELVDFIKERQIKQVRNLRQSWGVIPKLVIIQANDIEASNVYVRIKQSYGEDILVDVDYRIVEQGQILELINELNDDDSVHGIIVQLPLSDPSETDMLVDTIAPHKDVDGLGARAEFVSATATGIDWLLAGYNVQLKERSIVIVGNGRLVGKPLAALWATAGYDVRVLDDQTEDVASEVRKGQVIVTATGQPGLITEHMIQPSAVVVDAGVATENGKLVGDVAASVRERDDITITPEKGGVGPLTVATLFDHVILAARKVADASDS